MLRSRRIDDYFEVKLEELKPVDKLPVDIHLYFAANRHVLIWRARRDALTEEFISKYRARGIQRVWIHREDRVMWDNYLREAAYFAAKKARPARTPKASESEPELEPVYLETPEAAEAAPMPEPVMAIAPAPVASPPLEQARTDEGRELREILENLSLSDRHRAGLAAKAARAILVEATRTPATEAPRAQEQAKAHARAVVRDVLDSALADAAVEVRAIIDDVWNLDSVDPELTHAVNVASFAVLFAMAFGKIAPDVIADIALAALLHDIGLTQIPADIARIPWTEQRGKARKIYSRHVDEGLRLIDELAPDASPRVKPLVQQHHEKFDGTGYPLQLQGFQVNDLAQLVAMADTLESMSSGQWDGLARTLTETFDRIEKLEKSRNFPEFFNPEVFGAVTRWIRSPNSMAHKLKAADVVGSTTRNLIKRGG